MGISQLQGLYAGTSKDYSFTNVLNRDKVREGAWVQQRARTANAGSTWANDQEFLQGFRVNAMVESDSKLFLGTNTGIYFKKI